MENLAEKISQDFCPYLPSILLLVDGGCRAEQATQLRSHLVGCPLCQNRQQELSVLMTQITHFVPEVRISHTSFQEIKNEVKGIVLEYYQEKEVYFWDAYLPTLPLKKVEQALRDLLYGITARTMLKYYFVALVLYTLLRFFKKYLL